MEFFQRLVWGFYYILASDRQRASRQEESALLECLSKGGLGFLLY
jgi:hypothetical protein